MDSQINVPDENTFGGRLRSARQEAGLKAPHVVGVLNGYLQSKGLRPVNLNTFYSWEKIGTDKEIISGKSYPHPLVYRVLSDLYGVTGYWIFYGSMGGQIERYRFTNLSTTDRALEQRKAIRPEQRAFQRVELLFREVFWRATKVQQRAIETLLRSFAGED